MKMQRCARPRAGHVGHLLEQGEEMSIARLVAAAALAVAPLVAGAAPPDGKQRMEDRLLRLLKRFVSDWELQEGGDQQRVDSAEAPSAEQRSLEGSLPEDAPPVAGSQQPIVEAKRVAVIGAGPAGM